MTKPEIVGVMVDAAVASVSGYPRKEAVESMMRAALQALEGKGYALVDVESLRDLKYVIDATDRENKITAMLQAFRRG
jgi:hypothetical protein